MPKRKEPELTKEEQFKRFVETARRLGVDETGRDLEKAFEEFAKPSTQPVGGLKRQRRDS